MEYTRLGDTGMEVSRICLGGANFGGGYEWGLGEERSRRLIEHAIDRGITFFDTANVYSMGESERILGDAVSEYDRDRFVIGTKVGQPMDSTDPNRAGLSRKSIQRELADSLQRLGTETVDLYQLHRWDYGTPIEETLRTLRDAVRGGDVRYLGGSSMWAYQFAELLHRSRDLGLDGFASMQNHYTLTYREEEREMNPLCEREDVGLIPWSPLARGYLARPDSASKSTDRAEDDAYLDEHVATYRAAGGREINERVQELAERKDVSMAQIALAWLLGKDAVDAPVIGATSVEHIDEAVEAVGIELTSSEVEYLEEPYRPVEVFRHE